MSKNYSSNDMRSMAMNPNSSHYHSAMDNHSNQMNPNNTSYWSSRNDSSYGLDAYYNDYGFEDCENNRKIYIEKIKQKVDKYISLREEQKNTSKRKKRYKELVEALREINFSKDEVTLLFKSGKYRKEVLELLDIYIHEKKKYEYATIYLYSNDSNEKYMKVFSMLYIDRLKRNYCGYKTIKPDLDDYTIDDQIEYFNKKIKKLDKSDSVKIITLKRISAEICRVHFAVISQAISYDNFSLAKKAKEKYGFKREHFNLMEFEREENEIKRYRNLYNRVKSNEWIEFLVSVGAKASTNELTHLFYKLYK